MKQRTVARVLGLAAGLLFVSAQHARADDCAAFGRSITGGECRIAGTVSKSGVFAIAETLHVLPAGGIVVPAAAGGGVLTLNVSGSVILDSPPGNDGSRIVGDVKGANAIGAAITIDATGDIVLRGKAVTGALISSNQVFDTCSGGKAGDVTLRAGGNIVTEAGTLVTANGIGCGPGTVSISAAQGIEIDGVVQSETTVEASVGGGQIAINAGCALGLGPSSSVTSRGEQPGVDLVSLNGACGVDVQGEVVPLPRR